MTSEPRQPPPSPPPPWTCRVHAVACLAGTALGPRRAPVGLAVVDYAATPVGPYREAFIGQLVGPLAGTVAWMVVDSAASVAGGREHWALPKQLACLDVDPGLAGARVVGGGARFALRVRTIPVAIPVAVPGALRQPGRGPAPVLFRGRARPAVVEVSGELPCGLRPGRRPGVVLDGILCIGPPGRSRSPGGAPGRCAPPRAG